MAEWSHLPNAAHIDWVIRSVRADPGKWSVAWYAAWDAARDAARDAAWDAARDAAWDAVRGAAWYAARDAARDAAGSAAWDAARVAAVALTAWDHAGAVLHLSDEAFAGALALDPHMVSLVPARHVLKQEKK